MSSGKVTRFQNNVRVDGDLDLSNSTGNLTLSPLSSAPSSPTVGDLYYDSTLGKARIYQLAGWSGLDGTAAGSLDAAYNGGSTITCDTAAVTINDSITTSGALVITSSGVIASSTNANILYVNSTGAHTTSGRVSLLNLNMGAETATTPEGMRVTMQAETDDAIKIVKGEITVDDGGLTMSSVGNSTTSGWTVTTANTSGDGFTFNIDSLTSGDGFIIDGDATSDGVNYFAVQEGSSNIFTIGDDTCTSEVKHIIDIDHAEAFLVREQGDAADVFVIDTTQDAADTSVKVESKTTSGYALHVDSDTTTGNAVHIDADAVAGGNALCISVASNTMTASGAAISVIDSSNTDREVFAVRDDGSVYMYGTAEGTTVTQAVTGDVVITDGDLTVSGGETSLTDGVTTSGSGLKVTSSMTTAGAAAGGAGALTIVADSATTGTILAISAEAITSGDMLYLDAGAGTLSGGFYINCNDDNSSDFTVGNHGATVITGSASGTDALTLTAGDILVTSGHIDMTVGDLTLADGSLTITDADSAATLTVANNTITTSTSMVAISSSSLSTGALMTLTASATAHDGEILELINAGDATSTGTGMSITMPDIVTGAAKGIDVVMAGSTTTAKGVSVTMAAVSTGDMLYLDQSASDTMTAGSGFYINCNRNNTSDFSVSKYGATTIAGTAGGTAALTLTTGDLVISDTDATLITSVNGTGNIVEIVSGGVIATGKAMLELDGAGAWHANGTALLISIDGITDTNKPYAMRINADGVDAGGFFIDSGAAGDSVCHIESSGNLADNMAVLELTWSGAPANAGTNMLRVDGSGGTNTVKPVLVEILDDSVATGLSVTSAPTANDVAIFAGTGALTDGNAVVAVSSSGALATGGCMLELVATGSPTADSRGIELDVQKDMRAVYIDTDAATNHAVHITGSGDVANNKALLCVESTATALVAGSSLVRIMDSGSAAGAGATVYGLEVNMDGTNLEGIYVEAGTCSFAEAVYTASAVAGTPALTVTPSADMGETRATEGALFVDNTANNGCGLNVYSNEDGSASGSLVMFTANNAAYDTYVLDIDNNGTGDAVYINNAGASNALQIVQAGDSGPTATTDGAVFINNTANNGIGLNVFSDEDVAADGVLVQFTATNAGFDQYVLSLDNDGVGDCMYIDNAGASNGLTINQDGDCGDTVSSDGALHIENTGNPGIGLSVYSNHATTTGSLVSFSAANASFDTAVLTINNSSTGSTADTVTITNAATSNALYINQDGDTGETRASDGALVIENTGNDGCGLNVFSDKAGSTGSLVMLTMENASGDKYVLDIQNDGTADTVYVLNTGASNAIEVNQDGDSGSTVATDGAIHIENTGNAGIGLGVYSNIAASTAELVSISAANASFDNSVVVIASSATAATADMVTMTNASTSNALTVDQNGAVGTAVATDGAINIRNTGNTGIGLSVYTNIGATAAAELVSIKSNNAAFDEEVLYVNGVTDGSASTVYITSGATTLDADKAALEIVTDAVGDADSSVVRLEQTNTGGVSHIMTVKQDDIDKCYINFEGGTAADYTNPISTEQGDGTVEGPKKFSASAGWLWIGMVRCAVNGTKAYIPYYEEDPS